MTDSDIDDQHPPIAIYGKSAPRGRSSTLDVCLANNPLVVVVLLSKKCAEFGATRANRVESLDDQFFPHVSTLQSRGKPAGESHDGRAWRLRGSKRPAPNVHFVILITVFCDRRHVG